MAVEIFTVACRVCGSYVAGHVVEGSQDSYADIGASAVDALRAGRVLGITKGTVRLGGCGADCTGRKENADDARDNEWLTESRFAG